MKTITWFFISLSFVTTAPVLAQESFWRSLAQAGPKLEGDQLAFLAAGAGLERLGVGIQARSAIGFEESATEQLAELGDEMALVESFLPGTSEELHAALAQLALNLSHTRGIAAEALAKLGEDERRAVVTSLPSATTPPAPEEMRKALQSYDAALDRNALGRAAISLLVAIDSFLELQSATPPSLLWRRDLPGIGGDAAGPIPSSAGPIYLGGSGANRWSVCDGIIIDFGGDDLYEPGACSPPLKGGAGLRVVIDFNGNDRYLGTHPGQLGGGILGLSILRDLAGNDRYESTRLGQGAAWFGVGFLIDDGGDDLYIAETLCQGVAGHGLGILADSGGADSYRSGTNSQGFALTGGVGILVDREGNDSYLAGATPGGSGDGGLGIRWDGAGDDDYREQRLGPATLTNTQPRWLIDGGGFDISRLERSAEGRKP